MKTLNEVIESIEKGIRSAKHAIPYIAVSILAVFMASLLLTYVSSAAKGLLVKKPGVH